MIESVDKLVSLIRTVVSELVTNPIDVAITHELRTTTSIELAVLTVTISVADADVGRIIGRQGRTINAIRTLAGAIAGLHGFEVDIDVLE